MLEVSRQDQIRDRQISMDKNAYDLYLLLTWSCVRCLMRLSWEILQVMVLHRSLWLSSCRQPLIPSQAPSLSPDSSSRHLCPQSKTIKKYTNHARKFCKKLRPLLVLNPTNPTSVWPLTYNLILGQVKVDSYTRNQWHAILNMCWKQVLKSFRSLNMETKIR